MDAVVKTAPAPGFTLMDVREPRPRAGEVLLEVLAASVCGTDVHLYDWNPWAAGRVRPPRVMGHEMCGRVAELGEGVSTVKVGDRVAVETHIVCGVCPECLRGDFHVCASTRIVGVDVDGVFASMVAIPEHNLWPVVPRLSPELAALMEPFGNAVHACSAGRLRGQVVGVFGCGPIGCAAVAIARAENAARVVAADRNAYRLELAERMGADAVVRAGDDLEEAMAGAAGGPLDCALEMSGAPQAVTAAARLVRPGGWISLLGIGDARVELDVGRDVVMKGLTLFGITGRRMFGTWEQTTAYLSGPIDPAPLLTHRFALDEIAGAMELIKAGRCGKVVLFPEGQPAGGEP